MEADDMLDSPEMSKRQEVDVDEWAQARQAVGRQVTARYVAHQAHAVCAPNTK